MLIASWNVNSVRKRMHQVERLVDDTAADIICLQEVRKVHRRQQHYFTHWPDLPQAEFLARGRASLAQAKRTGEFFSADDALQAMRGRSIVFQTAVAVPLASATTLTPRTATLSSFSIKAGLLQPPPGAWRTNQALGCPAAGCTQVTTAVPSLPSAAVRPQASTARA